MTKRRDESPSRNHPREPAAEPVDLVEGIPDRAVRPALWKYVLIAAIFLAWLAFLIYCQTAAAP